MLKWHWWRFNCYGFFAGMVAGTAAAVLKVFVTMHPVFVFLLILLISLAAPIWVCLVTAPIYLAIQPRPELWISLVVCAVTSAILKFTWYDHLEAGLLARAGLQPRR